jgi:hypothetical protein
MGKGKKKKNQYASFYKTVKPLIKDNRVLVAIIAAMGVGVALASAVGSDKGRAIVDNITRAITGGASPPTGGLAEAATEDKKGKHPKQFAVE